MATVNMHEAKTRLSQLVAKAEAGEEVVISRAGKPVAKLTAIVVPARAPFGFAKGTMKIVGDIRDALPDDVLDAFYRNAIGTNDVTRPGDPRPAGASKRERKQRRRRRAR